MLCFVVVKRRTVMQLNLLFPGMPQPQANLWTALDEETRREVLERLAEVIASAASARPQTEGRDHD